MNQVMTIRLAIPQLTPFNRLAAPTPMIADDMTCVELTGRPSCVNVKMMEEEVMSAVAPLMGSILVILPPTVLIILQPPTEVPSPMEMAQMS